MAQAEASPQLAGGPSPEPAAAPPGPESEPEPAIVTHVATVEPAAPRGETTEPRTAPAPAVAPRARKESSKGAGSRGGRAVKTASRSDSELINRAPPNPYTRRGSSR